jgi:Leucine-rich repeat (LRR) protein
LNVSHNLLQTFPDAGPGSSSHDAHLPASPQTAKSKVAGPTAAETEAALCWPGLTALNVAYNQLTELPDSLPKHATKLVELYVEHNQLARLPQTKLLAGLTQLRKVCA